MAIDEPRGRVGTMVAGKWHIDERIGSGGMATVYAATHRNGMRAALKMLHAPLSRDPSTRSASPSPSASTCSGLPSFERNQRRV